MSIEAKVTTSTDPSDPTFIAFEMFRKATLQTVLDAMRITVYRDMPRQNQLECFTAGTLTGIFEVIFSAMGRGVADPDVRDQVAAFLVQAVAVAKKQVENETDANGVRFLDKLGRS